MSWAVDVLAVMRAASSNARLGVDLHLTADAIDAARDNVAELIEKAKSVIEAAAREGKLSERSPTWIACADMRAAIAKATGAQP